VSAPTDLLDNAQEDANGNSLGLASGASAGGSSRSNGPSAIAVIGIVAGGIAAILLAAAAVVRWTRKGRNRRFRELELDEDPFTVADPNPFVRGNNGAVAQDPWKRTLDVHHVTPTLQSGHINGPMHMTSSPLPPPHPGFVDGTHDYGYSSAAGGAGYAPGMPVHMPYGIEYYPSEDVGNGPLDAQAPPPLAGDMYGNGSQYNAR